MEIHTDHERHLQESQTQNRVESIESQIADPEAIRKTIVSQLRSIEFLALYKDWIDVSNSEDQYLHPTTAVLKPYIHAHGDRTLALEKLEQLAGLWNDETWRQETIDRFENAITDPFSLTGIRLDRLHSEVIDILSEKYTQPFESLQKDIEACKTFPDSPERRELVSELILRLESLIAENEIVSDDNFEENPERFSMPAWSNDVYLPRELHLKTNIAGKDEQIWLPNMKDIFSGISRLKFDELLTETLTPVNHERIQEETLVYGAKTANLREMARVFDGIRTLTEQRYFKVEIPRFEGIPASVYVDWKSGNDIDAQLQPYYEWVASGQGGSTYGAARFSLKIMNTRQVQGSMTRRKFQKVHHSRNSEKLSLPFTNLLTVKEHRITESKSESVMNRWALRSWTPLIHSHTKMLIILMMIASHEIKASSILPERMHRSFWILSQKMRR